MCDCHKINQRLVHSQYDKRIIVYCRWTVGCVSFVGGGARDIHEMLHPYTLLLFKRLCTTTIYHIPDKHGLDLTQFVPNSRVKVEIS